MSEKTIHKPLFARLLIEVDEAETVTASGIVLAREEKNKVSTEGLILDVGPHADECFKKGQRISFGKYAGTFVDREKRIAVLQDEDVLTILEKESK
jgi:co-chaperonin GroES (HSP10)